MNWGYKILIVYLLFVVGIVFMVFKSSNQKIDLVTTDYYAKELKYQEKIDAVKRTKALSVPVKFKVADQKISIQFPEEFRALEIKGTALIYYPADEEKDIQKDFITKNGSVILDFPIRNNGSHELQINWTADGKAYYFEDKLFL